MQRNQHSNCQRANGLMKGVLITCCFLLFLLPGCKREKINNALIGKWNYTDYYLGIGGPGAWHSVTPAGQTIEFRANGSFAGSESFLSNFNTYRVNDTATVRFMSGWNISGSITMGYEVHAADNTLFLYPVNPRCIEGCNNKFKRVY